MQKFQLFLRGDGGVSIGMGHIVRLVSIYKYLEHVIKPCFALVESDEYVFKFLEAQKIPAKRFDTDRSFIASLTYSSIVIIDGYQFSFEYLNEIRNCGSKLIYIDDLHQIQLPVNAVINHTPGFGPEDFNVDIDTRLFLGPAYCMIRPKFLANRKKRQIESINSVLVTLGMSNSDDLLSNTLAKVLEAFQNTQVYVLPGENTLSPDLNHEYLNIKKGLNEEQMVELLDSIDLAIVPMSTIYLEALSRGVLVAGGYFASNQHIVYNEVVATNLIFGIGDFHSLTVNKLMKLKKDVSSQLPTTVDANLGSGWNKVRELIESWIK